MIPRRLPIAFLIMLLLAALALSAGPWLRNQHWLEVLNFGDFSKALRVWIVEQALLVWIVGAGVAALVFLMVIIGRPDVLARGTATRRGQAIIVEALRTFAARPNLPSRWMSADALAKSVGAPGSHDPQFEADVQALHERGIVLLAPSRGASGSHFDEAMLATTAA